MAYLNLFGILLIALSPAAGDSTLVLVDDDGFSPSSISVERGEPVRLTFVFDEDEIRRGLLIPLFGIDYAYQEPVRTVEFVPYQDFDIVSQRYNGALMGYVEVDVA